MILGTSKRLYISVIAIVIVVGFFSSCKKDEYNTSSSIQLQFSTDSIAFDTVFTTVGTATKFLTVYNTEDSYVNISSIRLNNDANNSYRINVDGVAGSAIENVEIGPNDSLYIFIEVTVEPDNDQLFPFIEGDIVFVTNGNNQSVKLVAWGWDAIFYTPTVFPVNGLPDFTVIDTLNPTSITTWTNEKPIVIYGYLVVDSLQTLIVEPGAQIFFHQGAGLWIYRDGNIKANGTAEQPIVFQGDRLESAYDEQPGQWDRIWINEGSVNNEFSNVLIKNNFIGIQCETLPFSYNIEAGLTTNSLILKNVVIRNTSIAGIFSKNYRIEGENVLLSNGGQYLFAGTGAGQYNFNQSTFANNWRLAIRQTPALFITNFAQVAANTVLQGGIVSSVFKNCIIHGNAINEFELDVEESNGLEVDLQLQYCLIKAEEEVLNAYIDTYLTQTNYSGQQPGFVNFSEGDFRLIESAFVRGKGTTLAEPVIDLVGTVYNDPRPLGCFEYLPE